MTYDRLAQNCTHYQDHLTLFEEHGFCDEVKITASVLNSGSLRLRQQNSGELTRECFQVASYYADITVDPKAVAEVADELGVSQDNLMIVLSLHFSTRHALEDFGDFCRLHNIAYTFETSLETSASDTAQGLNS